MQGGWIWILFINNLKSLNFSQNFSVKMGRSETPRATPRKGRDWVPEARNGLETSDSTNFL